jgi:NAD(P)-dependent dehydrogenase (short-subunit alcohol dehydrogenase family)
MTRQTAATHDNDLSGTTAIVTGASRGFGRGIATALSGAGASVVGIARDESQLDELRNTLGDSFTAAPGDATDPYTARRLIEEHHPHTVVLCAGASPLMKPLQHQNWESFSQNWTVDVQQAFHWTRAALLRPLSAGSSVIVVSSGAAINGSPLSGGYAGAKATIKFIANYAAIESERAGLGISFVSVLPQLTPATDLGASGVAAYAERQGVTVETFLEGFGPALTPDQVGKSILDIVGNGYSDQRAYTLTSAGLAPLG